MKGNSSDEVRIQLDISREARHRLRIHASRLDCSLSRALDQILLDNLPGETQQRPTSTAPPETMEG